MIPVKAIRAGVAGLSKGLNTTDEQDTNYWYKLFPEWITWDHPLDERQNKSRDQNVSLRNGAHHLAVEHRRAAVAVDDAQIRGRIKFISFWSCPKKF